MTKNKLKWITCNGTKPDLPDGAKVRQIYMLNTDGVGISAGYPDYRSMSWDNVICYAIEPPKPLGPVQELIEAAKRVLNHNPYDHELERLDEAIKAVEEMNDE